jgi:hypothetical protein
VVIPDSRLFSRIHYQEVCKKLVNTRPQGEHHAGPRPRRHVRRGHGKDHQKEQGNKGGTCCPEAKREPRRVAG